VIKECPSQRHSTRAVIRPLAALNPLAVFEQFEHCLPVLYSLVMLRCEFYRRSACDVLNQQLFLRCMCDDRRRSYIPRTFHLHGTNGQLQTGRSQSGLVIPDDFCRRFVLSVVLCKPQGGEFAV